MLQAAKKVSPTKNVSPYKKNAKGKNHSANKIIFPAIIIVTCFVLYGNTIQNGYALDDGIYTNKNDFIIKGFSAFKDIFDKGSLYGFDKNTSTQYRPLTLLSFMAETAIFGFNPHVSHFFNVLFFALTALLLYFFLQKILKNYNRTIIIAATLLFVFHPIHTEVVANIKSRDEILGLLFGLVSFYFLVLYHEQNKRKYYFFSLAGFLAAIFCKENCLTFVIVIPLLLYFFTTLQLKNIIQKSLPYIGLVAFYLIVRSFVMQNMTFTHQIPVMDNALMSASSNADVLATCFVLLGKYIYMTIIPYPLSWDYSYNQIPIESWANIKPVLSLLVCVGLIGFMFFKLKKKSIYSFLIALFFITLLLSSNLIIKIASTFGERFLYTPSLSFCIVLPILIARMMKLDPTQLKWNKKNNFYIPVAFLLIVYSIIVISRNSDWKNNYTLFSSGIITSPNSARAHLSLANECSEELKNSNSKEEQQQLFNMDMKESYRALAIYNKYPEAYYNLGVLYSSAGMTDSAQIMFQKTLLLKPDNFAAADNLGLIYAQRSDYGEALKWFNIALKADSNYPGTILNIGSLYQKTGDLNKAEHYYSRLLQISPNNEDAKYNLFILYYNLGKDNFNKNEYDKALQQFLLAYKYNPHSAEAAGYIGAIYQAGRNFAKAEEYYRKSLEINPDNISVQRNLETVTKLENRN